MSMIERVARTIAGTHWYVDHDDKHWKTVARAAIEAMREPTEAMLNARWQTSGSTNLAAWQAMIDAALGEVTE